MYMNVGMGKKLGVSTLMSDCTQSIYFDRGEIKSIMLMAVYIVFYSENKIICIIYDIHVGW